MTSSRGASVLLLLLVGCGALPPAHDAPGGRLTRRDTSAAGPAWTGTASNGLAPAWSVEPTDEFAAVGTPLAAAGDVDGDGYDDLLVGDPGRTGASGGGAALLYVGGAMGLGDTPAWAGEGGQAGAELGWAVAGAGDVNGDGLADVLAGARRYDRTASSEGATFLYFGATSLPAATPDWAAYGGQTSAMLGSAVASAGDVDGDGFADVVVGAPYAYHGELQEGVALLFRGGPGGPALTPDWTGEADQRDARFGYAVASAGDSDGDGYDDVVVGAPSYARGTVDEGAAFLYLGSAGGLAATPAWTTELDHSRAYLGASVDGAGDVDGDGYDDLLIGAWNDTDLTSGQGTTLLFFGSPFGPGASPDWETHGASSHARGGWSVAGAGDVDADGLADLLVGSPKESAGESSEGRVGLFFGAEAGPVASWSAEPDVADAELGSSVTAAGDVNGDGWGDLVITTRTAAWAWYGRVDFATDADGYPPPEDCDDTDAAVNPSATEACNGHDDDCDGVVDETGDPAPFHPDADGDGYGDPATTVEACPGPAGWVVDATDCDVDDPAVHPNAREGYDGVDEDCDGVVDDAEGALLGAAVAVLVGGTAGVLVGAPGFTGDAEEQGAAVLWPVEPSGLAAAPAWVAIGEQAGEHFGQAVAWAGDVNGDGLPDALVGAPAYDGAAGGEGRALLYLGESGSLGAGPAWEAVGGEAGARSGAAVAGAGDVDGDGYADVLVGANEYDGAGPDEGRVDLYLGGAAGPSSVPAWILLGGQSGALVGSAVAAAGDVDADGYGDVVVGAPGWDDAAVDDGAAFVFLGSPAGLPPTPTWSAFGDRAYAGFGAAVAGGGDTNADGYADVVIGAPGERPDGNERGRVSWFAGSASGLLATPGWTVEAGRGHTLLGRSVSDAGDLDGDGIDDVVAAEPFGEEGSGTGRVLVFFGSPGGPAATGVTAIHTDLAHVALGWALAADDLDDDGVADLVVGNPLSDEGATDAGAVLLQAGGPDFWTDADGYPAPEDCDDTDAGVNPGAAEECDGRDNDCDGTIDESGEPAPHHPDADADGYGDPAVVLSACPAPPGYVLDASDCDDTAATVNPGAAEACDGVDDDCDGAVDEGFSTTWFLDADGDGHGDAAAPTRACELPAGYSAEDDDCDDGDPTAHPGAAETCDGADNDCDGAVDERVVPTWYPDADGDGYGASTAPVSACAAPPGFVADATDCDDGDAAIHPGAPEVCDDADQDCDRHADEGLATSPWYLDADGDGYGDPATVVQTCAAPDGYVAVREDCNDADPVIHPGAPELCDGVDNNCADGVDEGVETTWFPDADGDGYGAPTGAIRACTAPEGHVALGTDCDDAAAAVNPGATESAGDRTDQDCDGVELCYVDADDDGYRTDATTTGGSLACVLPGEALAAEPDGDCDDTSAAVNPGSTEIPADGVDNDCDGLDAPGGSGDTGETADSGESGGDSPSPDTGAAPPSPDCGCSATRPAPLAWAPVLVLLGARRQRPTPLRPSRR